ncbi:MAG TPA: hypothetical protein VMU25_04300 [Candidatus Paceibacterota bacterium]|nr:hypothetical protein [Candidatus Paceibacterota bacterium]
MDFHSAFSALSIIPTDWIIIACAFILIAADALRGGSMRAASIALALPIALYLFSSIPQTFFLGNFAKQLSNPYAQAGMFAFLAAIIFICIHQMILTFDISSSFTSSAISALAAVILILVVWVQLPALGQIWHFGPLIQSIFGEQYRAFWIVGSYLALAFVGS